MRREPATILLVDDEDDVRSTVATRLRGVGHRVVEARSGAEALGRLDGAIDLVVLDVMMDGLDGFGVLEALGAMDEAPPVLMLSARDGADDRVRALESGASGYLGKPFHARELVARVGAALRERRRYETARIESRTDALTGVGNRRAFDEALEAAVAAAQASGRPIAVVLADTDGLKAVNDTRGHAAGDRCLMRIASVLVDACGADDAPFRIGGDEFGVVITGDADAARAFLVRFGAALAASATETCRPAISTGYAVFGETVTDKSGLLGEADAWLYHRKRGRSRGRGPRERRVRRR